MAGARTILEKAWRGRQVASAGEPIVCRASAAGLPPADALLRSLTGRICPCCCEPEKQTGMAFCGGCWLLLTRRVDGTEEERRQFTHSLNLVGHYRDPQLYRERMGLALRLLEVGAFFYLEGM